jgi:hypothetical protein
MQIVMANSIELAIYFCTNFLTVNLFGTLKNTVTLILSN